MQSATQQWRVLTWNILGARQHRLDAVAAAIDGFGADVVALQEVQRHQALHIARRLGWNCVWGPKHYPFGHLLWWRAEGLAILSPHRLDQRLHRSISPGVHPYTHRRRVVLAATVHTPGRTLRVYDTHLAPESADERIAQARRIVRLTTSHSPELFVVAGDLNAHDEPELLREFRKAGLTDHGVDPTSPAVRPVQRIDYVLVPEQSTDIDTVTPDGGQQWHEISDHLPTMMQFTLPTIGTVKKPS